jgi:hypothetical protein
LEHGSASANALSSPPNDFQQLEGTQSQNSRDTSVFEGHNTLKSSNMHENHDFECANPALRPAQSSSSREISMVDLVEEDGIPFYLRAPSEILRREFDDFVKSRKLAALMSLTAKQDILLLNLEFPVIERSKPLSWTT